jgi:hypothetical protein
MSGAALKRRRVTPLGISLFASIPVAPIWLGLALFLLLLAVAAVFFAALGLPVEERLLNFELVSLAILAYAPTATAYELRAAQRDLRALGPSLSCSADELEREIAGLPQLDRAWYLATRVVAVSIGLLMSTTDVSWGGARPPLGDPVLSWVMLRSAILGWAVMASSQLIVEHGLRFGRLGARYARIELLDIASLDRFGRQGLRGVAVWLGLSVSFSLLLLAPWGREPGAIFAALFGVLSGLALWLPARGVHARIVATRGAELERVNRAIGREREANLSAGPAVDARLANLLAYRALVAEVRTWPFDLSTWIRIVVYVLLGLGSWLGGALVERLLGRVLGS